MGTPILGSVVASRIITKEEKEAGVDPATVAAQQAAALQQVSSQAMGQRGIQVRMMQSPSAAVPHTNAAAARAGDALKVQIFEPVADSAGLALQPVSADRTQPTGAVQSGVPPVGAEGVGLARASNEPTARGRMQELEQLEQLEAQAVVSPAEIQHREAVQHHRAFQTAGGGPKVTMRGATVQVHAAGSQRVESGGVVVLQLRGPIEIHLRTEDEGVGDDDQAQAEQEPSGEEEHDAGSQSDEGSQGQAQSEAVEPDPVKKLEDEAQKQERAEGDHGDDIANESGPVSVGDEGASQGDPRGGSAP